MECFVCIHCHFYQPPRENPWLEAVESQDSARPHHDWNERIAKECYLPNGAARILDAEHRISKIVNNYARISFNFGPTLLSWMEQRTPDVYQKVIDGDQQSQELFGGHGSALAQAYSHAILPLMNHRDKRTQIQWGIKDFRCRFGRQPEGMWLPETAVDIETLELLSAEGLQFTILAPRQAGRLRSHPASSWVDLEYGVDSRRAYVCPLPSGRNIALFFYDGMISNAVAFERLLLSGENFARRLLSRLDPEGESAQLMHVATDGETYGHHHTHGDMALAYALEYVEKNRLARLTNYGQYLAMHPPNQEICIRERTSWSCVHGVARWETNCGCNSGGRPHWSQQWRRPLRDALDWLRDDLAPAYEREAKKLLLDPWLARDDYIACVLDRSPEAVENFLAAHRTGILSPDGEVRCLRLLEMQRHLMLMYTSCGWFFDEPTGPETVQVLQYAGRAVQLGHQLFGGDREREFLKRLELVHSNIQEFGNGREIFERFVRPAMLDLPGVAAHYAISSFFEGYRRSPSIYAYRAQLGKLQTFESANLKVAWGTAHIASRITHAQLGFNFAVVHSGGHNLRAGISQLHNDFEHFIAVLRHCLAEQEIARGAELFDHYFGREVYSLKSLFQDERRRIVGQIVDSTLSDIDQLYGEVYQYNTGLISFLGELSMPLPAILRVSSEFVLNRAIRRLLTEPELDLERLLGLLNTAAGQAIAWDASVKSAFSTRLDQLVERWAIHPMDLNTISQLQSLVSLIHAAPLEADLWKAQNAYYATMLQLPSLKSSHLSPQWLDRFRSLGDGLGMARVQFSAANNDFPHPESAMISRLPTCAIRMPRPLELVCTA
ncbi:MAG: DUF3536 domain-containing protein, partial [Acidobacteria bacterium]|nr:DUF3536 domain-containing protein [Acidobacteriota bacterium]